MNREQTDCCNRLLKYLHKTWSKLSDVSWTTFPKENTGNNIYNTYISTCTR